MELKRVSPLTIVCLLGAAAGTSVLGGYHLLAQPVWEDLRFPATRLATGAANPPSFVQFLDDGAGSDGVYVYEFSDETAVNEEQVWAAAQMPHRWSEGSDIDYHVHWTLEDATDCNVRWCAEYATSSITGNWPANTTTTCGDCPSNASASVHNSCDIGEIDMSGHTISAMSLIRVYRNSSHANDTCNGKAAYLHEFDIHFQVDSFGSAQETSKQ